MVRRLTPMYLKAKMKGNGKITTQTVCRIHPPQFTMDVFKGFNHFHYQFIQGLFDQITNSSISPLYVKIFFPEPKGIYLSRLFWGLGWRRSSLPFPLYFSVTIFFLPNIF